MDRKKFLLVALVLALSAPLFLSASPAFACDRYEVAAGLCVKARAERTGVAIDGTKTSPGGKRARPRLVPVPDSPSQLPVSDDTAPLPPGTPLVPDHSGWGVINPVTMADIAWFRPNVGAHLVQPNGWSLRGLDTNFVSTAAAQVTRGELLGQQAEVKFIPSGWSWSYGDGSSRTLGTGGRVWAGIGVHAFDPTPTSHVFRAKGSFRVRLVVHFTAVYRIGGGDWIPVVGELAVPARPVTVRVGTAKTVLVAEDCNQNPHGPGC